MTDENETKPLPPQPASGDRRPLLSARETAFPPPSTVDGDQSGPRPTPARAIPRSGHPVVVEPDIGEVQIEVEGRVWTVTVLGRAGGAAATPLLLLGFEAADRPSGGVTSEALVVGKTLSGISEARLVAALGSAATSSSEDPTGRAGSQGGRV